MALVEMRTGALAPVVAQTELCPAWAEPSQKRVSPMEATEHRAAQPISEATLSMRETISTSPRA